LTGCW